MVDKEISLILELWDTVKVYIPVKERLDAATHVLQMLDEYGIDIEEKRDDLSEHCAILEKAVKNVTAAYSKDYDDEME